jgi:hypothetical protein
VKLSLKSGKKFARSKKPRKSPRVFFSGGRVK